MTTNGAAGPAVQTAGDSAPLQFERVDDEPNTAQSETPAATASDAANEVKAASTNASENAPPARRWERSQTSPASGRTPEGAGEDGEVPTRVNQPEQSAIDDARGAYVSAVPTVAYAWSYAEGCFKNIPIQDITPNGAYLAWNREMGHFRYNDSGQMVFCKQSFRCT